MLKRLRRIAALAVVGFFAFAPPGTLILAAAIALGLLGKVWLAVGAVCLALLGGAWVLSKRRRARSNHSVGK